MKRRELLGVGLALAAASVFPAQAARAAARVKPGAAGWPGQAEWASLKDSVGGRLAPVARPDLAGPDAAKLLANPFYIADQPGLTESSGYLGAWRSSPSAYSVTAQSAHDIAAAVNFARIHNLRLVIKGRGHSYFGASNAPDSLLVWTRHMDDVTVHDAFTPAGSTAAPVSAVTCGGGAMWLHAYQAVTGGAGRYVQGGGCTTVGVAGLVQGGGFGSFSKAYGTAGASLLEAEIVTADGQVRVVNQVREPELFWALKGGGGGTFGVITRLTLATHELPTNFGALRLTLRAKSDAAYQRLLAAFAGLVAPRLCSPNWGESVHAGPDNRLRISMVFQGLTEAEARAAWQPLIAFAQAHPEDYDGADSLFAIAIPPRLFWNAEALRTVPGTIDVDTRPGAPPTDFWWAQNTGECGIFWHAYASTWMPASLLQPGNRAKLVDAWFAASRHWGIEFHFNKGLAGAPAEALGAARDTPMNPEVTGAFALAIIGDLGPSLFTGALPSPDAPARAARVHAAMAALRRAAPDTGAYVNECDYFQADWQRAFWGPNYPRLLKTKRRYDPAGLFTVHHGVGSEDWSADGFVRTA